MDPKKIIERLLPDFAVELMNRDDTVTGAMAVTNALGFGFDEGDVESAEWDGGSRDRIAFKVSMKLSGEQRDDMGRNGDELALSVSGIAVRNGVTWEVRSYDIDSCESNADAYD